MTTTIDTFSITGAEYERVARQFYRGRKKRGTNQFSSINSLRNWFQQVKFKDKTNDLLNQIYGGPCGVFAVIQAYIIMLRQDPSNIKSSQIDILNESLLCIEETVTKNEYLFCIDVNSDMKSATFVKFSDRGEAFLWLTETSFTTNERCCLLFSFGLTYLVRDRPWFSSLPEPFVLEDASTSMAFVWLMLTGRADEVKVSQYQHQTTIGVKVIQNRDPRVNGTHLNPDALIFVVHRHFHYFCIVIEGELSTVFDPLSREGIHSVPTSTFG